MVIGLVARIKDETVKVGNIVWDYVGSGEKNAQRWGVEVEA